MKSTTLPSDFYLGPALSVLVEWCYIPMFIEQVKKCRELVRKLVIAGADLHYRNERGKTLLQSVLSSCPLQMICDMITECLQFLAGCDIDVGNYTLQESLLSDGEPFEVNIERTIEASAPGLPWLASYYTCIEMRAIRFECGNIGHPIPKVLLWVDPESPASLVLEEFKICQDLIITSGTNCICLWEWIPLWQRSPQDLRDVPTGALYMLAEMGWDFERR